MATFCFQGVTSFLGRKNDKNLNNFQNNGLIMLKFGGGGILKIRIQIHQKILCMTIL